LSPGEGLTIAVAWPKGFVTGPTVGDEIRYFFTDNAGLLVALVGLLAVLAYYLKTWSAVGRDPAAGTIFPRFEPPQGLSPAATRFIRRMAYDRKAFSAALIDMAVKGFLRIKEDGGTYELERQPSASEDPLASGEKAIARTLLGGRHAIKLMSTNHRLISESIRKLKSSLEGEHERVHFLTNRSEFYWGAGLTVLTVVVAAVLAHPSPETWFLSLWLAGWSAGCIFLAGRALMAWRDARAGRHFGSYVAALFASLFAVPFLAAEAIVLVMLGVEFPSFLILSFVALGAVNIVFFYLLKAPTLAGRKLMDEINGFRMYLGVAEKERLNLLNPPERTPELFERYLPYALALDVENEWSEAFADVLARAAADPGRRYQPSWYSGRSWSSGSVGSFGSSLASSLSSSIASAATAPGSSSGSGGGGSSGGGGGGGGGGGW
ncbi:MAG TPA: DUF2207 domain-containing protein, partial [Hyphomicrobium sp.]